MSLQVSESKRKLNRAERRAMKKLLKGNVDETGRIQLTEKEQRTMLLNTLEKVTKMNEEMEKAAEATDSIIWEEEGETEDLKGDIDETSKENG